MRHEALVVRILAGTLERFEILDSPGDLLALLEKHGADSLVFGKPTRILQDPPHMRRYDADIVVNT